MNTVNSIIPNLIAIEENDHKFDNNRTPKYFYKKNFIIA